MQAISASVIVLAGTILLAVGSFIQHGDTQLFVQAVGCLVGITGLVGWAITFKNFGDK